MTYLKKCGALFLVLALSFINVGCGSGNEEGQTMSMTQIAPPESSGWILSDSTESYDRETIFDYINGAGEVYLSFGFEKVDVFRYSKPDEPEITLEIFDMGGSDDAYGIFSYAREKEDSGIGGGYEQRGSLLCFWQDRYYICIVCYRPSDQTDTTVSDMARHIAGQLPPNSIRPDLVQSLPEPNLLPNSIHFFHIHPTLNYHYFLSEKNILNLNRQTRAVLGEYGSDGTRLLCVQYPSDESAGAGHDGFIEGYIPEAGEDGTARLESGLWVGVKQHGQYLVIVLDAAEKDEAINLIAKSIEKLGP